MATSPHLGRDCRPPASHKSVSRRGELPRGGADSLRERRLSHPSTSNILADEQSSSAKAELVQPLIIRVSKPFLRGQSRTARPPYSDLSSRRQTSVSFSNSARLGSSQRISVAMSAKRPKTSSVIVTWNTWAITCVHPCRKYSQPSSTVTFRLSFCASAWCMKSRSPR